MEATAALNMFPKFDDVPMSTYLIVLAKVRRPSAHAVGEHAEVLFEQDDVGGVLGDVGGGFDRDPDVGGVERDRVVDAVAEERDVAVRGPVRADEAGLLFGAHPGEDRRVYDPRHGAHRRRAPRCRCQSCVAPTSEAEVAADLLGDDGVVAGDDLHRDAEPGEAFERRGGVELGLVQEHEVTDEGEVVLVGRRQRSRLRGRGGWRPPPRARRRRTRCRGCAAPSRVPR